jgi:hypothetical protein
LNKEQIQQRIDKINNEIIQVRSSYIKLEGHLAEAEHWLLELDRGEKSGKIDNEDACQITEE